MNKKLNNKFIKQLIDSDFIFLKSIKKTAVLNTTNLSLNLENKFLFNILDIFQINTSLKQFIKILFLLKTNKNFTINIWCKNKYFLGLIDLFIKEFKLTQYVFVSSTFPLMNSSNKKINLLFIVGNLLNENISKLIETRILQNNIFLINKLNFSFDRYNLGFYKIQNDILDYKKLILILVIIFNVIKNK